MEKIPEEITVKHSRSSIDIDRQASEIGEVAGRCTKNIVKRFCSFIMKKIRNLFS
jgi:hypothetical protein